MIRHRNFLICLLILPTIGCGDKLISLMKGDMRHLYAVTDAATMVTDERTAEIFKDRIVPIINSKDEKLKAEWQGWQVVADKEDNKEIAAYNDEMKALASGQKTFSSSSFADCKFGAEYRAIYREVAPMRKVLQSQTERLEKLPSKLLQEAIAAKQALGEDTTGLSAQQVCPKVIDAIKTVQQWNKELGGMQ